MLCVLCCTQMNLFWIDYVVFREGRVFASWLFHLRNDIDFVLILPWEGGCFRGKVGVSLVNDIFLFLWDGTARSGHRLCLYDIFLFLWDDAAVSGHRLWNRFPIGWEDERLMGCPWSIFYFYYDMLLCLCVCWQR